MKSLPCFILLPCSQLISSSFRLPPGRLNFKLIKNNTFRDLIRHLVDKKQFDISSLLSDETRDDFGATRPTQGPYGYGPNSLRGVQHISLTGQQPAGLGGSQLPPQPPQPQDHGYYPQQENHHHQGYPSHQNHPNYNRGNSLPPPNGMFNLCFASKTN